MRVAEALSREIRTTFRAERVTLRGALYALERVLVDAHTLDACAQRTYGLTGAGRSIWRHHAARFTAAPPGRTRGAGPPPRARASCPVPQVAVHPAQTADD